MKQTRRLISLLMAMAMVFALAAPAWADDDDNDAEQTKGSITIKNYDADGTYTAYKIFDLEYEPATAQGEEKYTYTINSSSPWLAAIAAEDETGLKPLSDVGLIFINPTADADGITTYRIDKTESFSASSFAKLLKRYLDDHKSSFAAEGTPFVDGKAEELSLGYYLVTSMGGALCNLTSTDYHVTIREKNEVVFDKVDDKVSVDVGERVSYTITGKVPNTTGYTNYIYQITDTMTDGLTFNNDVAVYIKKTGEHDEDVRLTPESDYTCEERADGFVLTINVMKLNGRTTSENGEDLQAKNCAGDMIEITYTATVNEKAVARVEHNRAILEYSNNPNNFQKTTEFPPVEETVYSAKIIVDKYKQGQPGKKLNGAVFYLYKLEDVKGADGQVQTSRKYYQYVETKDETGNVESAVVNWLPANSIEDLKDDNGNIAATAKTTGENNEEGIVSFDGLADGTYYLEEYKAPNGYNKLPYPVEIWVAGASSKETAESLTIVQGIENSASNLLPSTGGTGTALFYIVGGILVVGAAVLLIAKLLAGREEK